jgi:hypothetical protein
MSFHQNTNANPSPSHCVPLFVGKVGLGEPFDERLDAQLGDRAVGLVVGRILEG